MGYKEAEHPTCNMRPQASTWTPFNLTSDIGALSINMVNKKDLNRIRGGRGGPSKLFWEVLAQKGGSWLIGRYLKKSTFSQQVHDIPAKRIPTAGLLERGLGIA